MKLRIEKLDLELCSWIELLIIGVIVVIVVALVV
jgi:hypothetical protein